MSRTGVVIAALAAAALPETIAPRSADGLPQMTARAQSVADISTGNTSRALGRNRWEWWVFLLSDDATLEKIKCVQYVLHPTFSPPVQRVCDQGTLRGKGFVLRATGWGTFLVGVQIDFQDGTALFLQHELRFTHQAEGWRSAMWTPPGVTIRLPVSAVDEAAGRFDFMFELAEGDKNQVEVSLVGVEPAEPSELPEPRSRVPWTFSVYLNGEMRMTTEVNGTRSDRAQASVYVPIGGTIEIRVLGSPVEGRSNSLKGK